VVEKEEKHFFHDRLDGKDAEGDNEGIVAPANHTRYKGHREPLDGVCEPQEGSADPVWVTPVLADCS